jgi:mono/diheme cytochrome c family protein
MYTGLLHTHKLVVVLFLLHYLIKTVLLVLNKNEALEKYSKPTRIPEMVISALFLLTGVAMLVLGADVSNLLMVKIAAVLASIPLAVIGFKKKNKALAVLSLLLIVTGYGLAEMSRAKRGKVVVDTSKVDGGLIAIGKTVYTQECQNCHGAGGDAMLAGAKNLKVTVLNHDEIISIIRNGKNTMAAYKSLSDEQVEGVTLYVESLRE